MPLTEQPALRSRRYRSICLCFKTKTEAAILTHEEDIFWGLASDQRSLKAWRDLKGPPGTKVHAHGQVLISPWGPSGLGGGSITVIRNPPPPEERNYLLCALKSEMLAARCHGHTGLFTAWAFPGPEASSVATQSTAFTTSSAGEPGRLWGPRTQARPPSPISSGNRFQAGVWTNGTQRSAEAGAPPGRFCSAWRSWIENHHDTVTDGRHPGARLRQRVGLRCPLRCVPSGFTPKATPPPEKQPRSPFSPNVPGSVGFAGLTPLPPEERTLGPWLWL